MGTALLDWGIKLFALLGVAGTAGFAIKWIQTFFTKQRELNAIDADARKALQDAAAGWQSTAEAQKALRAADSEQSALAIASLEKHRAELIAAVKLTSTTLERERAIVDWAFRMLNEGFWEASTKTQANFRTALNKLIEELAQASGENAADVKARFRPGEPLFDVLYGPMRVFVQGETLNEAARIMIQLSREQPSATVPTLLTGTADRLEAAILAAAK